jgi:hypothetical protein
MYYSDTADGIMSDYVYKYVGNTELHVAPFVDVSWKYWIFKMATPLSTYEKVEMRSSKRFLVEIKFKHLKCVAECSSIHENYLLMIVTSLPTERRFN